MAFVKLDSGILDSTLWVQDAITCKVFITMLAMCGPKGLCEATAPGIARRSNTSLDETRRALEILESPDDDSRTLEDEGRRIRRVDGGYLIVNYLKYREKDHTAAERMRKYRTNRKQEDKSELRRNVTLVTPNVTQEEAEAEEEAEEYKSNRSAAKNRRSRVSKDEQTEPMDLQTFVAWCQSSAQPHVLVLAEWAEITKPALTTKAQWRIWMKRHLRPARDISVFSDEQVTAAFKKMQASLVGKPNGFITQYTLETVLKFITGKAA
jgi:hypothetical protein